MKSGTIYYVSTYTLSTTRLRHTQSLFGKIILFSGSIGSDFTLSAERPNELQLHYIVLYYTYKSVYCTLHSLFILQSSSVLCSKLFSFCSLILILSVI